MAMAAADDAGGAADPPRPPLPPGGETPRTATARSSGATTMRDARRGDELDGAPPRADGVENHRGESSSASAYHPPRVESTSGAKPEGPAAVASSSREISPSSPGRNCNFAIWHYEEPEAMGYAVLVMGE